MSQYVKALATKPHDEFSPESSQGREGLIAAAVLSPPHPPQYGPHIPHKHMRVKINFRNKIFYYSACVGVACT